MRLLHPGDDHGRQRSAPRTSPPRRATTIRLGLEGNLCRCTGYHNIVKAVQSAAKKLATEAQPESSPAHVAAAAPLREHADGDGQPMERMLGKSIRRIEIRAFITGRGTFTDDIKLPGTHHAVFVRSSVAHARIPAHRHPPSARPSRGEGSLHRQGPGRRRGERHPGGLVVAGAEDHRLPGHRHRPGARTGEAVAVVVADSGAHRGRRRGAGGGRLRTSPGGGRCGASAAARRPVRCTTAPPTTAASTGRSATGPEPRRRVKGAAKVVKVRAGQPAAGAPTPSSRGPRWRATSRATDELTLWVTSQNPHVHRLIMGALRARDPRAEVPGHRPRRGRRLRLEDLRLPGGGRRRLACPEARACR